MNESGPKNDVVVEAAGKKRRRSGWDQPALDAKITGPSALGIPPPTPFPLPPPPPL